MGHGLVVVPRRLWRNSEASSRLRKIQAQAPRVYEKLEDAIAEHEEVETQVADLQKRKTGTARDFQEWIDDLVDLSNLPESRQLSTSSSRAGGVAPTVITDRYLADLTRKLKRAQHKRARFVTVWDSLLQDATATQAILDSHASKRLDFGKPSPNSSFLERWSMITPHTRYLLHAILIPYSRKTLAVVFTIASSLIIWSEIIKRMAPKLSVISMTVVHHPNQRAQIGFAGQVIASAWILYMCACALSSVSEVKVWGNRALVRRNTYGESACWYAGQTAKLTVPLAYNFLTFLPDEIQEKTTFYQFLGKLIDLTPLSKGFDYFFPIFILLPVCAALFNLYGRVKSMFGFGVVEDDEEDSISGYGTASWRDGRDLINRELHGGSSLGLSSHMNISSPRPSLDSRRAVPLAAGSRLPPPPAERARRQPQQAGIPESEEEDEGLFQGFAHRLRNTIDSTNKPRWLEDIGEGFPRPKWMSRDNNAQGGSSPNNLRWFGGRSHEGGLRL